jgi:S-adenosylmethionine synthetase
MEMDNGMAHASSTAAMRTAEMVTDGHPDKFCDQVADAILDAALRQDPKTRAGIECLAKDSLLVVTGEVSTRAELDVEGIARNVWERVVGYGPGEELTVISHVKLQSPDIARGGDHSDAMGGPGGCSDGKNSAGRLTGFHR